MTSWSLGGREYFSKTPERDLFAFLAVVLHETLKQLYVYVCTIGLSIE